LGRGGQMDSIAWNTLMWMGGGVNIKMGITETG